MNAAARPRGPAPGADDPTAVGPARIAFDACCFSGNPTGIANYAGRLLTELCAAHPDVQFFGYSTWEPQLPRLPNLTVRVITPRWRGGPLWQNTQVIDMIEADGIDVFWGPNGFTPFRPMRRTATVVTVHDLVHRFAPATQLPKNRWKQRLLQRLSARTADRVVAVSASTANDVRRYYGRRPEAVIHPIAASQFRLGAGVPMHAEVAGRALPEHFVLCVATQEPRKNLTSLLQAYLACIDAGVGLPPLVLAGGRGWLDTPLRSLLDPAIATGTVVDLGYVADDELAELYGRCDLFVLPSVYEGFGMPLLEAQACGAPVLHGAHASMVEASGGVGVAVDATVAGLRAALEAFARGELPIACRLSRAFEDDGASVAEQMWRVAVDAWQEKRQVGRSGKRSHRRSDAET